MAGRERRRLSQTRFKLLPSRSKALLVGCPTTGVLGLSDLNSPSADISAWQQLLTDCGWHSNNIRCLAPDGGNPGGPSSTQFAEAANDMLSHASSPDSVLIFFSGHGYTDINVPGKPFKLLTHDSFSSNNGPVWNSLNWADLATQIRVSRAQCVVTILDCCRSGVITKGKRKDLAHAISESCRAPDADKRQDRLDAGQNIAMASDPVVRMFLSACADYEDALDGQPGTQSPFTESFIQESRRLLDNELEASLAEVSKRTSSAMAFAGRAASTTPGQKVKGSPGELAVILCLEQSEAIEDLVSLMPSGPISESALLARIVKNQMSRQVLDLAVRENVIQSRHVNATTYYYLPQ